jgi:hypothetical protein
MNATAKLLDKAKALLRLTSDNKLAHHLGWPQSTITGYRTGRTSMDVIQCREFFEKTGIPLEEVVNAAADDKLEKRSQLTIKLPQAA